MSTPGTAAKAAASSSMNLVKSIIESPATNALERLAKETYDWLIREKVDKTIYEKCQELATNLAFPNEDGHLLLQSIEAADRRIMKGLGKVGALEIIAKGSLGRLIGSKPELAYIVTTVSALAHSHHETFAAELLCSMIFDKGGHEKEVSYTHNAYRVPVKAVLSKIVESVYLNVTNAGHTLPKLPSQLEPYHQHVLDDRVLAGLLMGIQQRTDDIVIQSANFLVDLTTWLYYHFDGMLCVVIREKILLEESRGSRAQRITLMVKDSCLTAKSKCCGKDGFVEASVKRGSTFTTFLRGSDDSDTRPRSYTRQDISSVDNLLRSSRTRDPSLLKRGDKNTLMYNAKMVMQWLLDLPVQPLRSMKTMLMFQTKLQTTAEHSKMHLRDLVRRHPQLLQSSTGEVAISKPIFQMPEDDDPEDYWDKNNMEGIEYDTIANNRTTVGTVESCFPYLSDALGDLRQRCTCNQCEHKMSLDKCQEGCLREAGMTYFILLIGSGVADAMGAVDVSGATDTTEVLQAVLQLFHEVVQEQILRWDTFFQVTATVTAGCPYSAFDQAGDTQDTSSAWIAVQVGSFIASASWLDLKEWKFDTRPFSITISEGKIRGIGDDFGMLQCEMMEGSENEHANSLDPEEDAKDEAEDLALLTELDTIRAEEFSTIFPAGNYAYRLLMTVRSGTHEKIVDPTISAAARFHVLLPECKHESALEQKRPSKVFEVHDFDQALDKWSYIRATERLYFSKLIDSVVKLNTLISISSGNCVIRESGRCCLECAWTTALQDPSKPRHIINFASVANSDSSSSKRKRAIAGKTH